MLRPVALGVLGLSLAVSSAACSGATPTDLFGPASATSDAGASKGLPTQTSATETARAGDAGADASSDDGTNTCKITSLPVDRSDACDACDLGACCSELQACDDDFECRALVDCLVVCSHDATCQQACTKVHADAMPKLNALGLCQKQSCVAQCG